MPLRGEVGYRGRKRMEFSVKIMLLLLLSLSWLLVVASGGGSESSKNEVILDARLLEKFVDPLPDMPRLYSYRFQDGVPVSKPLKIGMFQKNWKFHRDLPETRVFAYGITQKSATVPGPTIESLQGTPTIVTWENRLHRNHILPWDATIPSALPTLKHTGVPTVVHLHGGLNPSEYDGHSLAWFTYRFRETGPTWSNKTYQYPNEQHPGNLWYHDHAMGLTRVNLLAGLLGAYVIRNPPQESPLGLPSGTDLDRHLVLADRSFLRDGSIYMNRTGNNPDIHPQWQPEYFGETIVVNGKIWPYLNVYRRRYRFRIINTSNARFFQLFLTGGLQFIHIGSDSAYLPHPVPTTKFLLGPSEIADVIVDFSKTVSSNILLHNDAPYPYPSGDAADNRTNGVVMKFVIMGLPTTAERDESMIPVSLISSPAASQSDSVTTRYVAMYEYESGSGEPTHLYLNGKSYEAPATETPRVGTSEIWEVINLTEDNHPLHIHLGLFVVLEQREIIGMEKLKECMKRTNDGIRCRARERATGRRFPVPEHESNWKNVFKMRPGFLTTVLVRFAPIHSHRPYPFNALAEPGYVYHCHILDHEDNVMMRPLKIIP